MYENYKGHRIEVLRESYGANGNPGKISWSVDYKDKPTVFDEIVGFKTVKMVMHELKKAVDDGLIDKAVRPNQIFAVSLPYSMLDEFQMKSIVDRVKAELFTPKGLRTLSPKNRCYSQSKNKGQTFLKNPFSV